MLRTRISIPAELHVELDGELTLPDQAIGIVLFAHGSGSSRFSPRNNYVASILQQAGMGTLLFDLLTREEDRDYETRFDIPLLTRRLLAATTWLERQPLPANCCIGYFGASTGAAAALKAASQTEAGTISAVVSRGGRPDLAGPSALSKVSAPTLLIVGGDDDTVIRLNRDACDLLMCEKKLLIVPGATHLFEEPGTLEQAALAATAWFVEHFSVPAKQPPPRR